MGSFAICGIPDKSLGEKSVLVFEGKIPSDAPNAFQNLKPFEIPKKIFDSVLKNLKKTGKFIFVTSSLSNYQKLIDYAEKLGLKTTIIAKKKLFFEELILVEAKN